MAFREVNVCEKEPESLSKFEKLSFLDINRDTSFIGKYVQGIIDTKWGLVSAGNKKRMKMILAEGVANEDKHPPSKITVFLIGAFAEEFIEFEEGDTVIISEARFQKSPSFEKDGIHPCLIVVENVCARPSVWVIPATKSRKKRTNATRPHARPVANSSIVDARPSPTASASTSSVNNYPTTTKSATINSATHKQGPRSGDTDRGKNCDVPVSGRAVGQTTIGGSSTPATSGQSGTSHDNNRSSGHPTDARMAPEAGSPSKQRRTYTYTVLKDLGQESVVNIYGVVKFFKPPYMTRGTDYCMTVTITDPSLGPNHRGLRCQLFRESIEALPQVHAIGDIVRFHRLKITEYEGSFQGQKGNGFHCLVFDGRVDGSFVPRSTSPNYTLTDDDKEKVTQLRQWGASQTQLAIDNRNCTLGKVYTNQYLDLVCQVVTVTTLPAQDRCTVIRVWDGTHYKKPVRVMDTSCAVSTQTDQELVNKSGAFAVDVSMYDNHMETGAKLKPGQFIKICNLHAAKFRPPGTPDNGADMIELVLHGGTAYGRGVILLMNWEVEVKEMVRRMDEVTDNDVTTIQLSNQNAVAPVQITRPLNSSRPSVPFQNGSTNESRQQFTDNGTHVLPLALGRMDDANDHAPSTSALSNQNAAVTALIDTTTTGTQSTDGSKQGTPNRCMQRSATVLIEHFQQKATRIADVITSEAPNKFRIRAKIANYFPHDVGHFTHLYCYKCKYKGRVPSKSPLSEKTNTQLEDTRRHTQETTDGRKSYNLRNLTSRSGDAQKQNEPRTGVLTRSAAEKMVKESMPKNGTAASPSRRNAETSDESSVEMTPPGQRGIRRKHPGSKDLVEEEEESTRPRKSGKGVSKKGAVTGASGSAPEDGGEGEIGDAELSDGVKLTSTEAQRKTARDILGNILTAELQDDNEKGEEVEEGRKMRRRRVFVNVNGLTVQETLLMARKSKHVRFIHHPDLPKVKGHPVRGHGSMTSEPSMVYYLCPRCSPADGSDVQENAHLLEYKYCINLVLDDGTGTIEVFVLREHAQMFFKDIPATNLHLSLETKFRLEDAMAKLCPYAVTEETDVPLIKNLKSHPWIDCCVMSYHVNLGGTETVKYQMFDTSLALDVE